MAGLFARASNPKRSLCLLEALRLRRQAESCLFQPRDHISLVQPHIATILLCRTTITETPSSFRAIESWVVVGDILYKSSFPPKVLWPHSLEIRAESTSTVVLLETAVVGTLRPLALPVAALIHQQANRQGLDALVTLGPGPPEFP